MPTPLPRAIHDKLEELASQVRRLRLVRGLSWLALTLLAGGALAVFADYRAELSGASRSLLLLGWLGIAAFAAWRLVWRPWRQPIAPAVLAAAIEAKYPSLAERLFTLVDLQEHTDAENGSKALIELLAKDTNQRAKRLNFFRAAPMGAAIRLGFAAFVVVVAALGPVLVVSGGAERIRRFLLPWYAPRASVPWEIVVSSGDVVARRGEPVTLTAFLKRTSDSTLALPETATVVYREVGADAEKKLPMAGDDKAAFT